MSPSRLALSSLLFIFYCWILLEGVVRKWILPNYTDSIYFVKYFLAILILIRVSDFKHVIPISLTLKHSCIAFLLFCILSVAYVGILNSPIVGLLGFMSYFAFVPLAIAVPLVLNTTHKIEKLLIVSAIISMAISILGIVQYYSTPDSWINKYATNENASIDTAGTLDNQVVRVSTVFSYHSGNATYVLIAFVLMFPLLFTYFKSLQLKLFIYLAFCLNVISLFMTGSRAAVVLAAIIGAVFILCSIKSISQNKNAISAFLATILIILSTLYLTDTGSKSFNSWDSRFQEGAKNNEYASRANDLLNELQEVVFNNPGGLLGYGIGVYQNGASRFNRQNNLPGAEDQAHRIGLELGPIGLLLWYSFTLTIWLFICNVYVKTQHALLKNLTLIIAIYAFWGPALFRQIQINWVDNLIWWSCLGLVIAIQQIESSIAFSNENN